MSDVVIQGEKYEVVGKHYLKAVPVILVERPDVWKRVREAITRVADVSMSKDEEAQGE